MGFKWYKTSFEDGDVVTPDEIVSDCRVVTSEMNGFIDRANFQNTSFLSERKLQDDATNQLWYTFSTNTVLVEPTDGTASNFRQVDSVALELDCKTGVLEIEASVCIEVVSDNGFNVSVKEGPVMPGERPRFQMVVLVDDSVKASTFPEGSTWALGAGNTEYINEETQEQISNELDTNANKGASNKRDLSESNILKPLIPAHAVAEGNIGSNTLHCNCMVPISAGSHKVSIAYRLLRIGKPVNNTSTYSFNWQERNLYVRNILR